MNQQIPQIDWSKAPEGTTHYNPNSQITPWYQATESEWLFWNLNTSSWYFSHTCRKDLEFPLTLIPRPDWSAAPTDRWHRQIKSKYHTQPWRDQLIPRPTAADPVRLQRFDKRRLAEHTMMLGTDTSKCWLPAGTVVKVGGYVQFDPQWGEVVTIHWESLDDVGYVTTIVEDKLLPLETPEEQAALEQIEALYQVLASNPGSYAMQAHQLYDAGCRMPLNKTKE